MSKVVLITGGDLGDTITNCLIAKTMVSQRVGNVIAESTVMQSEAWGFESSSRFANQVLVVESDMTPEQVLKATQQIELEFGRERVGMAVELNERGERIYKSREMDIDILFYDDITLSDGQLTIPHPMLHLRKFVLDPLCEVIPHYTHPQLHQSIVQLRNNLEHI